jgi:indole-3-glycerol phosphate synthase
MALEKILTSQRQHIQGLARAPLDLPPSDRDFLEALKASRIQPAIIAELKPKSPSEGVLTQADYRPENQAKLYEEGGAAALSVLTEAHFFNGKLVDLTLARQVTQCPVLCKDFILDTNQVKWARHAGADACLLIVAALDQSMLIALKHEIESHKMLAVIEVHTREELERALAVQPKIILINNRNLWDLSMHPETTLQLLPLIPAHIPVISASGFKTPADIKALPSQVSAVLIGTQLMREGDPRIFLRQLA